MTRRLTAHKRRDNLGSLPIAVVSEVIDLLHRSCVDTILATIWEAEQHFACEVGLVIFDTYSKGIAAGGGDEDKAKDQNVVQANLRRLFDRGCHVTSPASVTPARTRARANAARTHASPTSTFKSKSPVTRSKP